MGSYLLGHVENEQSKKNGRFPKMGRSPKPWLKWSNFG
jgi:hypothetical protein